MPPDFDIAIVGAGLIGLAIGRAAALQGMSVLIAEKHKAIATETSARNSGVIHAGLYYPPGSLKAQLCVAGARQLYTYAHARNIPHNKCGKLIVGGDTKRLEALKAQGTANGVDGLTLIDAAEKEPALKNHTALYSPHSGVIDTHAVAYSLLADFETAGGTLALNTAIQSITPGALITTAQDKVTARHIINAAGLHAHLLARATQHLKPQHIPQVHYAKGVWCRVSGHVPFSHLIYPLPPETGLGVHLTLDTDGTARLGPDSTWVEAPEYSAPTNATARFAAAVQDWWPALDLKQLTIDQAGIRPRLAGPGQAFADFRIDGGETHGLDWLTNLFGIESPGLTAALAIGEHVAQQVRAGL